MRRSRHRRPDPARRWVVAAIGLAASIGAGTLIGSETVGAMDPFYRHRTPTLRERPVPPPDAPPPVAYAPIRAPDFAPAPPDAATPYDDPALLDPRVIDEPDWTPRPLFDEQPAVADPLPGLPEFRSTDPVADPLPPEPPTA